MDRETTLLLALGMLVVAALTVGISGLVLVTRDRRLMREGAGIHPEAHEES